MITSHVLDTAKGRPAEGITITLRKKSGDSWQFIAEGVTNEDGRIRDFLPLGTRLPLGTYKMHFETMPYFIRQEAPVFYPEVSIEFNIQDDTHYHIPLLLSPYGYTTYRGS